MKWVCAWCESELKPPGCEVPGEGPTSHGICEACAKILLQCDGIPLQSFIEEIAVPILLVDGDVRVKALNQAARDILGKPADHAVGKVGGSVFNCGFSRLPGGCGQTIHCSGCAIRNAVIRTYETGEPQIDVPATLTRPADSAVEAPLHITTFKAGDVVALRIEGLN